MLSSTWRSPLDLGSAAQGKTAFNVGTLNLLWCRYYSASGNVSNSVWKNSEHGLPGGVLSSGIGLVLPRRHGNPDLLAENCERGVLAGFREERKGKLLEELHVPNQPSPGCQVACVVFSSPV